jgi:Tol biopolymer transport system component
LIDIERSTPTRLTFDGGVDVVPLWSADGRTIYFSSRRDGTFKIYRKSADGSDQATLVLESKVDNFLTDVSSDGKWLLYSRVDPDNKLDVWVYPLDGSEDPRLFLSTRFQEGNSTMSPDGKWIAYTSDESGEDEIYVRPFPGPGGKWQVSAANGRNARWSSDGKFLFYTGPRSKIYRASITTDGSALKAGRAEEIVAIDPRFTSYSEWILSRDATRFGFIQSPEDAPGAADGEGHVLVRFVFDWFDELEGIVDEVN